MKQLYTPTLMNVVVFFSGGASSARAMLNDPNYGRLYRITGAYTDNEDASGRQLCNENDIPDLFITRREFYREQGLDPKEWSSREAFYEMLAREIEQFHPDVIALSGYMHIVTDPLLSKYTVLNVHPADLAILSGDDMARFDASGFYPDFVRRLKQEHGLSRKFKGENAVYDAIMARETELRSTVHIATEDFDEGPVVVQSKQFPVLGPRRRSSVKEYASQLQELMKQEGDGPAYCKALELIATGRLAIDGETLFLDGKPLPYSGFRLD